MAKPSFTWEDPFLLDSQLAADERQVRNATRDFAQKALKPRIRDAFRNETTDPAIYREMGDMGLLGATLPPQFGGAGLNYVSYGLIAREIEYVDSAYRTLLSVQSSLVMLPIFEFGTEAQKEKYLKPLLEGKITSCFSMTEPENAGSNPLMMNTTAVKEGEYYIINGHKWFTSSADAASFAIVMALTDPDNPEPYRRTSQIIVDTKASGFNQIRNIPIMGDEGSGYFSHAEIKYENCKTPVIGLLGPEGAGYQIAQTRLGPGRIHHCMRWIGICERAFGMMCQYAMQRQTSPGKVLAEKQTIQNWIAESRAEINASKLMVLDAAEKIDMYGQDKARVEISIIKFYVANVLQNVLDRAIQTHGGLGITDDTLLSWWYRHERGARIYDGPDEVHKSRVAKDILKSYKQQR